jgi:hypothetical protein
MHNLTRLTPIQLDQASQAAAFLCELKDALNHELLIKLDTLHADLAAEIEDRTPVDPGQRRPAEAR